MSTYYEFDVALEGRGIVGVYADSEDEAREDAEVCDESDIEVTSVAVTDVKDRRPTQPHA